MPPLYLAGYDGTSSGRAAVRLATSLAADSGARIVAVHVATELDPDEAGRLVDDLRDTLDGAIETRVVTGTAPAAALHRMAVDEDAALLVVGPHRGPSGRRTGSTARALLNGAPCPVVVAPEADPPYDRGLRRIAVAYDGSDEAETALGAAAGLALSSGADLRVLTVEAAGRQDAGHDLRARLADAVARLERPGRSVAAEVLSGEVAEELVAACRRGEDLLITGSRPKGPAATVVAGSVAGFLADHAPCPVLVVPRSAA